MRYASGEAPTAYHNDHSRPENPRIRRLEEEIARIVRGRAANPKWINGVKRHGYKGAFEIAATVDYLFAFAATTGLVRDTHFDLLYDAYLGDDETRSFIETNNPTAAREIAARFGEAITRLPQVVEAFLVTGEYDYLIKVAVAGTEGYEEFLRKRLYKLPGVRHSRSTFVLKRLKHTPSVEP